MGTKQAILFSALAAISLLAPVVRAGDKALVDTSKSPNARMYMADMGDVKWSGGLWGDRFDVCRTTMVPHLWELFQDPRESAAWENYQVAAGASKGRDGKGHGPPFNDGDFLKWFESVAQLYASTHDPKLDALMDSIIPVIARTQRDDGYLFTQAIIAEHAGGKPVEFSDPDHFETYNMGHLMTAACVHYRATGKTSMLDLARKSADYLDTFLKKSPIDLAKAAICPAHYMGVMELYRATGDKKYLELASRLIEIRDLVSQAGGPQGGPGGSDQNQDRIPFGQMTQAVGHAVRANYLYAGVSDLLAETPDQTLLKPLTLIARDVQAHKLYITGTTGALYDGASPDGSTRHNEIQLVHQAYGRDYELPNLSAYNESCATVGYALWNWRMLALTGDAAYGDLFEQSLYNGVLAAISLDGKNYFYVNPLKKIAGSDAALRWSRTRQPNIPSSFCCPPNIVRTIAEAQNYIYSLSKDTLWVNLYGGSTLKTAWSDGGQIALRQETDYPWNGAVRFTIEESPNRPISLKFRIPGWLHNGDASMRVNGQAVTEKISPGSYAEVKRGWKKGDVVELTMNFSPVLMESNPLVEETLNQAAVRNGPIVYCLESNDLPAGTKLQDVALSLGEKGRKFSATREKIANAEVATLTVPALQIARTPAASGAAAQGTPLYHELTAAAPAEIQIKLVPYYAWGNRGDTEMSVWLPIR